MRILICARCLTEGGAERVASLWAKGFCQRGHKVDMVLLEGSLPITYQVPEEIKIHKLYLSNGKHFNSFRIVSSIRSIIKDIKPAVIITVLHPSGYLARIASMGLRIPVIFTDHNSCEWPDNISRKTRWYKYFIKYILSKFFYAVTVLTDVDRRLLSRHINRVYTLPNPLTFNVVERIPRKERVILAAGRLDAWYVKGFDCLIRAWGLIASKYPDWKLEIAGQGSNNAQNYLNKIACDATVLDQLEFIGFVDLLKKYEQAEIFVLSSRYEGFGMVLTEAMSQGCAPIACDYNGRQSEIIRNNEEGIICPTGDVNSLALAISTLIEDSDKRNKVQQNAIKRASDYEIDKIMNIWCSILSKIQSKN